ncbi:aminoacyl-tRNA hydrolase [Agyrium rufum]|nr:aminoacyl-tRNA hydrolase [Agyrium rufum]
MTSLSERIYRAEPSSKLPALFLASLGNPPPHSQTYHSAGHIALRALQKDLASSSLEYKETRSAPQPAFVRAGKTYANGLLSQSAECLFALYQCPTAMNISGPAVAIAYRSFLREFHPDELNLSSTNKYMTPPSLSRLVVVHDDLDKKPGQLTIRKGGSARGHNGLKSIVGAMSGDQTFWKIGVGIGRPRSDSRDSAQVSRYVLSKLDEQQMNTLESSVDSMLQLLTDNVLRRLEVEL